MRIAVEGCGHGKLHDIYASVKKSCQIQGWDGVSLLIIGGDFQAVRNAHDLNAMSVPAKYRAMGDFHEYYSGARTAPYLTLFVGGNHEASNHLWELYYGGWVAPKIYYMGAANVLHLGPLRITGLSGIWKGFDYNKPHFERLPYRSEEVKSAYHVRELDVRKLLQLRTQVDVGISHDWPRGIEWKGDWRHLFRIKRGFEEDARSGRLGSSAAKYVMDRLRPRWWFAAHLHCKFAAVMNYEQDSSLQPSHVSEANGNVGIEANVVRKQTEMELDQDAKKPAQDGTPDGVIQIHNKDEIDLDMDEEEDSGSRPPPIADDTAAKKVFSDSDPVSADIRAQLPASFSRPPPVSAAPSPHPEAISNKTTHFLALDKCLPNRKFLQLLDLDPISAPSASSNEHPFQLMYDKEWLAITRAFASINPLTSPIPRDEGESHYRDRISAEMGWIEEHLVSPGKMAVPENFEITAPVYDPSVGIQNQEHPREYTNPQTARFCELVGIENFFDEGEEERKERRLRGGRKGDGTGLWGRGGSGGGGGRDRGRSRECGRGRGRGFGK